LCSAIFVIPAQAGIQRALDSRLRGNDGECLRGNDGKATTWRENKFIPIHVIIALTTIF